MIQSSDQVSVARDAADTPHVVALFTGGTIQCEGRDSLDLSDYLATGKKITGAQLIERVPEVAKLARITSLEVGEKPSSALGSADLLELLRTINGAIAIHAPSGVIIGHGTNTLEESAFFLHLALKTTVPVVLFGAMRPSSALSSDGELNLVKAIITAASPAVRGMGVLVVMNDGIYSARDVSKDSTYRVNAFTGRDLGPLGFCDSDQKVLLYHSPLRSHTRDTEFDVGQLSALPHVSTLVSHIDAEPSLIDAAVGGGAEGIVMAGSGAGGTSPAQYEALGRARDTGVAVCIASRIGNGRVSQRQAFSERSFVTADNLNPWKARILLSLALTRTRDPAAIQTMFDRY